MKPRFSGLWLSAWTNCATAHCLSIINFANVVCGPTAETGVLNKNMNIYPQCVADEGLEVFILLS